jgi:hypothetical protein
MRFVLGSLLLAACIDHPNGSNSVETMMPLINAAGPDLLAVSLRCRERAASPVMNLELEIASAVSEDTRKATATIVVGASRLSFEALNYGTTGGDDVAAPAGRESAMRALCDGALVEIVDFVLKAPDGITTMPSIWVAPVWE